MEQDKETLSPPPVLTMSNDSSSSTEESSSPNMSTKISSFKERVKTFQESIQDKIDFRKIRELAFGGIPEEPGLRSVYWKLLFNYLPGERSQWKEALQKSRKTYQGFVEELTIDPRKSEAADDHPLSTASTSTWNAYWKDHEIIEEVDKDAKRTLPHLHFFNHDSAVGDTSHYEALKRILFIYAKLNPGIKYVQGMNEILGPIYYIFATDPDPDFKGHAEEDAFFCFTSLMAEIRDNFCKTLDKSSLGITGLMQKLNNLLKEKDYELWNDLEKKGVNPQFYSFRWLTLLLSQEFDLPDVLRLWDSLFADPQRFDFLLYVCCAMIVVLREQILDGTFADNIKALQSYPIQDVHIILKKAEEIREDTYQAPPPRPVKPEPVRATYSSSSAASATSFARMLGLQRPVTATHSAVDDKPHPEILPEEDLFAPMPPPPKSDFVKLPRPFEADDDFEDSSFVSNNNKNHPLE